MIVVYIVFFIFKSREHFLSACVHCELANVAFTLGQTNHLYLSHGEQLTYNKIITNLLAQFDSRGSFVSRKPGLYAFHFFPWRTIEVERGLNFLKIQITYVLYLATHHMVMLMQETPCFSI